MYHDIISGVKSLGLLVMTAMALSSPLEGQRSGAEIWGANCGRCHLIQPINRYDAKAWEDIGLHMAITARLTSAETTAVIDLLKSAARRVAYLQELEQAEIIRVASLINVAPPATDPVELYQSQCAACHGKEGAGDGIASVAYNPQSTNFTNTEFAATRTQAQVRTAITDGFNAMPPFAGTLSPEDIGALAAYLLGLGGKPAT
jgi:cytochrome c553